MTPARAWTPTSDRRTTSSVTSTGGGWRRPRSLRTKGPGDPSCTSPTRPSSRSARSSRVSPSGSSRARRGSATTPCGSPASTPPSWTSRRSRLAATSRCVRCSTPSTACATCATSSAFLGEFEQIGGSGAFAVYVDVDGKNSDRTLVNVVQGGLGLPDETYYHDEKFAEIREKYVAFLTRMFELVERPDAGRRGRDGDGGRDPALPGALGARRDARRPEDLQPAGPRGPAEALPGLRLDGLHPQPGRLGGDHRRDLRPAAVVPRAPLRRPGRGADRGLARLARGPRRPGLRAVPRRGVRRDQLRLLRPHPRRYAGAARAVEARRRAGRGLDRRGGRPRVRRASLPAGVQGDDGGAGRQPAARLPAVDLGAGLDERGDQAGGLPEARPVPVEDRLPRRRSATTPRSSSCPTTCSRTSLRPTPSRRGASWPRSAPRSTATSG